MSEIPGQSRLALPICLGPNRANSCREQVQQEEQTCAGADLFNHLVGAGQKHGRHFETNRPRSLEVDGQFVLGRLLHRKIGGLGAQAREGRRPLWEKNLAARLTTGPLFLSRRSKSDPDHSNAYHRHDGHPEPD
jgi:hypothetical protein